MPPLEILLHLFDFFQDIPGALLCQAVMDDFVALLSAIEDIISVLEIAPTDTSAADVSTPVAPGNS